METVNVARLKASLSEYLSKVKRGEEVVVTERGRPVARLIPISIPDSVPEDERERLLRLAAQGKIRLPKVWPTREWAEEFLRRPKVEDPEGLFLRALLDEREENW